MNSGKLIVACSAFFQLQNPTQCDMCPSHPNISILNEPKVQITNVKLCVLLEDCMGCMMAGAKYVPQPLGKLMQIKEERTLRINMLEK